MTTDKAAVAAAASATAASEAMEKGNGFYAAGNFDEAIVQYLKAITIKPTNPIARRNLTAVLYEQGDYPACLGAIEAALTCEDEDSKRTILRVRRAKCHFFMGYFEEAKVALQEAIDGGAEEQEGFMEAVESYLAVSRKDKKVAFEDVASIPRLRPNLSEFCWHILHGYDYAIAAITDEDILAKSTESLEPALDLAFFYGADGDARSFYQQLHHLDSYNRLRPTYGLPPSKEINDTFFMALQDESAYTMARTVIILRLLHDLASVEKRFGNDQVEVEREQLLSTIWYVYGSDIMPPYIHTALVEMIDSLIDGDETFGIDWLKCTPGTYQAIRQVFIGWVSQVNYLTEIFNASYAQTVVGIRRTPDHEELVQTGLMGGALKLEKEWTQYKESRMVYPSQILAKAKEPELHQLLKELKTESPETRASTLKDYAAKNWNANFTLWQATEYYDQNQTTWIESCDTLELMDTLLEGITQNGKKDIIDMRTQHSVKSVHLGIVDAIAPFFTSCSNALQQMNVKVTIGVGDTLRQLDFYRWEIGGEEHRAFDIVYLGNSAEYYGGHLSMLVHAIPSLKDGVESAFVQSSMPETQGFFYNLRHTMAEYFCLPSVEQAECFLGLKQIEPALVEEKAKENTGPPDFSMSFWGLKKKPNTKPQKELFGRWLIHVFFKLAIPFPGATVCQPLTLSTFVRLCIYLVEVRRIPAHWITAVVDKLLVGLVNTSARPPAHLPQELFEVTYINWDKKNRGQTKDFRITAFIPELKSLLTRYQPLLPFHLLTPLPLRSEIAKYTMKMELDLGAGPTTMMNIFAFILAKNATTRGQEWGRLHKLLSQGNGVEDAYFYTNFEVKVLDKGVWSHLVEIAWWMEETVAEEMRNHKWGALMVRIDNWTVVGSLKEATEMMEKVSVS